MLLEVIKTWPTDLYNAKAIIFAVNVSLFIIYCSPLLSKMYGMVSIKSLPAIFTYLVQPF